MKTNKTRAAIARRKARKFQRAAKHAATWRDAPWAPAIPRGAR